MSIEKNSIVLAAGCVDTMNLFALGDNCQNFYILLDLKICDKFASNYPIDLKLGRFYLAGCMESIYSISSDSKNFIKSRNFN